MSQAALQPHSPYKEIKSLQVQLPAINNLTHRPGQVICLCSSDSLVSCGATRVQFVFTNFSHCLPLFDAHAAF